MEVSTHTPENRAIRLFRFKVRKVCYKKNNRMKMFQYESRPYMPILQESSYRSRFPSFQDFVISWILMSMVLVQNQFISYLIIHYSAGKKGTESQIMVLF